MRLTTYSKELQINNLAIYLFTVPNDNESKIFKKDKMDDKIKRF